MMTEGQEKDEFWNVLGGKGDYSNSPRLQVSSPCYVLFYSSILSQNKYRIKYRKIDFMWII